VGFTFICHNLKIAATTKRIDTKYPVGGPMTGISVNIFHLPFKDQVNICEDVIKPNGGFKGDGYSLQYALAAKARRAEKEN